LKSLSGAKSLTLISVLSLTACEAPPIASQAVSPSGDRTSPWTMQISASGAAIVHTDAAGEVVRLACRTAPDDLYVEITGIEPIGSEDRLTVGAGGQVGALVADLTYGGPGVVASGIVPDGFLAAVAVGEPIGLAYGATYVTLPALDTDMGAQFAAACGV
jgi:hypothetical protein